MLSAQSQDVRQYVLITVNYWGFTLTDGALRMLVVLYFHQLGYAPLDIALLFVFYEAFGVVTNLLGGWLGSRWGLNRTMNIGLALQIVALSMLAVPSSYLSVVWVMAAQALSGIAKDLNKMSAKSAIKLLVPAEASSTLYRWVARLTGSKNTLKGVGFFLGGLLLATLGFRYAMAAMAAILLGLWLISLAFLRNNLGRSSAKPKFSQLLSKSPAINVLSFARMFLFGARDVWFVVALPVFFTQQLSWSHSAVGGFMATWIIAYGLVQTQGPRISNPQGAIPTGRTAFGWAASLCFITTALAIGFSASPSTMILLIGLILFGFAFAVNSSLHSFLIVQYANRNAVSIDVGFYYMANAGGRLLGTVLSGAVFQAYGLAACLWVSSAFIAVSTVASLWLPNTKD